MGSVQSIARTVVELLMWSRWSELLIKVGMLWTGEKPDSKAIEENMTSYFNTLQGFLLLSHGSTVGAGPTLSSSIHASVKQVVDSSFRLMKETVSLYGVFDFLEIRAYDKAAFKCNGREVVTNFERGSHNLDLNLGIATPGHGPKENKGHLQFQPVPYSMHFRRSSRVPSLDPTIKAAFYFGYEDKPQGRTGNFVFAENSRLRQITSAARTNLVAKGGFGNVYKGYLSDGSVVAVNMVMLLEVRFSSRLR
ncbi:hypothetical protein RIF29_30207 [Crotalaria pallida]|uniref:Cyclin-D1-binding protein 1-like N-terminal domain-containing protein n=1 Tax=Crotalaria pallida TaxID=3830 RepID=A0AAN9HWW0_CROPI